MRKSVSDVPGESMINRDILKDIAQKYGSLTKSEKLVATHILKNPESVLQNTISDLAEICGVADTTVFRFCRTMNFKGYQAFRIMLALNTKQEAASHDYAESDDCESVPKLIMQDCVNALIESFKLINHSVIDTAINMLCKANCIYFFGMGGSGIIASCAKNKFIKITPHVIQDYDTHIQLSMSALLNDDDIAVVFSNSGTTRDAIEIARLAKLNNAMVIFITCFPKTPAVEFSDVLLLSGAYEGPLQGGSSTAFISQYYMVEVLYEYFFRAKGSQAVNNKLRTSMSIAEKML